jgi:hypothetical protein
MADQTLQRLAQGSSVEQFEMFFQKQVRAGEERLMLAILESAVENYQKYIVDGDNRFEEAEKWLFVERDSKAFCSFENICEILQLHPDYIRQGLLGWKKLALATDAGQRQKPKKLRNQSARLRRIA